MNTTTRALSPELIKALKQRFTDDELLLEPESCWAYGYDNSTQHALPDAVIIPNNVKQIQQTIRLCHQYHIPFTTRGRGSCTTGAAVPHQGGIVCCMEKLNKVLELSVDDRYIVVEAGAINQELQDALKPHQLFWPPDPTSSVYSTIGGNLACNAGGPHAVKYGTCRDNILGLEFITGKGDLIQTGVFTTKGVVGYDFTRLMVGSEGTLGVITKAILKLTPLPEGKMTLRIFYKDIPSATQAIAKIMRHPVTPCVLEFADTHAINAIRDYTDMDIPQEAGALLMIEVDGEETQLGDLTKIVADNAKNEGLLELTIAKTEEDIANLWKTRKALSPALKNIAPKKINEDVVVPVSKIPKLIDGLNLLSEKYQFPIVNFGHAGNGNIHVNLLIDGDNEAEVAKAEKCLDEVFALVIKLKGTLSGEHGIGLVKKQFVHLEIDQTSLSYMKAVKTQFDPHDILNPGKALPFD